MPTILNMYFADGSSFEYPVLQFETVEYVVHGISSLMGLSTPADYTLRYYLLYAS